MDRRFWQLVMLFPAVKLTTYAHGATSPDLGLSPPLFVPIIGGGLTEGLG